MNIKLFSSSFGGPTYGEGGGGPPVGPKTQVFLKNYFDGTPYHFLHLQRPLHLLLALSFFFSFQFSLPVFPAFIFFLFNAHIFRFSGFVKIVDLFSLALKLWFEPERI